MASLHAFRHLPTADLYSALWEAWLRRLEQKGERTRVLDDPRVRQEYTRDVWHLDDE